MKIIKHILARYSQFVWSVLQPLGSWGIFAAAAFDFGQASNWASIVDLGGRYAGSAAGLVNMIGKRIVGRVSEHIA